MWGEKRLKIFGLAMGALLIAVACQRSSDPVEREPPRERQGAACSIDLPPWASAAEEGQVVSASPNEKLSVGRVSRDASLTLVGFCLPNSSFPEPAPLLQIKDRQIGPSGGELVQTTEGWSNFYIYPPTREQTFVITQGDTRLATAMFARPPVTPRCDVVARPRVVKVLGCGSILVVRWASPLRYRPREVALIDIDVLDKEGEPLNFYKHALRRGAQGLSVVFGFQRPPGNLVRLRVNYVYVHTGDQEEPIEVIPDPPITQTFRLVSRPP